MFGDNNRPAAEMDCIPMDHIPGDEGITLWRNFPKAHERPATAGPATWAFVGKFAMPNAEHLIPFLN